MARKKINVITLGCSKNLVDSERLMRLLHDAGLDVCHDDTVQQCDIIVLNTCGFIGDAKEESIQAILEAVDAKRRGEVLSVYVMGCLSQRYCKELKNEIPEVDGWYGKFDWKSLVNHLTRLYPSTAPYDRVITTPSHHAYLKVAEGCNRFCSFCAIPLITGRYTSRPIEEIEQEVRMLVDRGVKELNVIAQDLSSYGIDLYGRMMLPQLVDRIANIKGVEWIRLHYAYPAQFPMELLDVMERHPNVCRYIDIALQHINDAVLGNMRRHITAEETRSLICEMRRRIPGLHIRTTLMVGFPGEGETEFDELMRFVRDMRFERMGAFAYCEEEDTFGAKNFTDSIPDDVKQERLNRLMKLQEDISLEIQQSKIGQVMRVIVDREEDDYYIGRSQWDSPEVDPEVLISKDFPLECGEFYNVEIDDAMPFELMAHVVK